MKSKKVDKSFIFYACMLAFPILQFCVFYIGVNINSVLMSFQKFDPVSSELAGWTLNNVGKALKMFFTDVDGVPTKILLSAGLSMLVIAITTPLCILFSFYIAKKRFGSSVFRVFLFLPSILSALVLVTIYQYFVERALPDIVFTLTGREIEGIMQSKNTRFWGLLFFNVWFSFGNMMLIYSNAISAISPEVVEAANLDGAVGIKELRYVALPLIWPTFTTFMVATATGIFTNQFNLFSFYGAYAPEKLQTLGYYLFKETQLSTITNSKDAFSHLSALGIITTCFSLPLTIIVRKCMEKFGPSTE